MYGQVDDGLISHIYDAAVQPETWPDLLGKLAERVGGHSAWLSRLDVRTGNGSGLIARIDPKMPELYRQYYGSINPIAKIHDAHEFMRRWSPGVVTDEDRLPKRDLVKTEFYNDFLRPQDVHSTLMIRLSATGMTTTVINIHRDASREQFQAREVGQMQRLVAHLVRALTLTRRLAAGEARGQDLASVMERSVDPMMLLAADGRLRQANSMALKLMRERADLHATGGFLRARHPRDDRVLQAALAAAGPGSRRLGGDVRLTNDAGSGPLSVTVTPVGSERLSIFEDGASILVCVSGFESGEAIADSALVGLFGLSAAEARVAASLLDQRTPAETAVELGLSVHTVRAHLARMFAKTDTRRQSELVGLLMKGVRKAWS